MTGIRAQVPSHASTRENCKSRLLWIDAKAALCLSEDIKKCYFHVVKLPHQISHRFLCGELKHAICSVSQCLTVPCRQRKGLSTGTLARDTAKEAAAQVRADLVGALLRWFSPSSPPAETVPASLQGLLRAMRKGSPTTPDLQLPAQLFGSVPRLPQPSLSYKMAGRDYGTKPRPCFPIRSSGGQVSTGMAQSG